MSQRISTRARILAQTSEGDLFLSVHQIPHWTFELAEHAIVLKKHRLRYYTHNIVFKKHKLMYARSMPPTDESNPGEF